MIILLMVVALIVVGCQKNTDKTVSEQTAAQTGSATAVQEDQEMSDNLNDLNDLDAITTDVEADVNVDDLDKLVD